MGETNHVPIAGGSGHSILWTTEVSVSGECVCAFVMGIILFVRKKRNKGEVQ